MWAILGAFNSIPFVGRYKTALGSVGVAAGTVMSLFGVGAGDTVRDLSLGYMGLGIAHGKAKTAHGTQ